MNRNTNFRHNLIVDRFNVDLSWSNNVLFNVAGEVKQDGEFLYVNGAKIVVFGERDPGCIKWVDAGAEYIVESTGVFTTTEKAGVHLNNVSKV